MTAPTPRPEGPRIRRPILLGASAAIAFAVFAVTLTRLLPSRHARSDYLIIGTLATLAALITIFAGLLLGRRGAGLQSGGRRPRRPL